MTFHEEKRRRQRAERRERLGSDGLKVAAKSRDNGPMGAPACKRCSDFRYIIVQGKGRQTCPDCGGDAA